MTTTFTWQLKRSARRSVAIHIRRDGHVEVRAPLRYPLNAIDAFVRSRQSWIEAQLVRLQAMPMLPLWGEGRDWWHQGKAWPVHLTPVTNQRALTQIRFAALDSVTVASDDRQATMGFHIATRAAPERWPELITQALQDWQALHARPYLTARVDAVVARVGESWRPSALRFRCLKARWGSCSADGRIMLNTQLMQLPDSLIDYVICHELAHLREMNHSAAFYAVQQTLNPQWRSQRIEMKQWAQRLLSVS